MKDRPGDWTVRGEYIEQSGDGYPAPAIGVQKNTDLFPSVGIALVVVACSLEF